MNLVSKWLVRLIPGGRTVQAVAAHQQQAEQLRASGRASEALSVALEGLSLRNPPLPPTSSGADLISLVSLTILAEELATQLGVPGAKDRDILESVTRLRYWNEAVDRFPDLAKRQSAEVSDTRARWLTYLEERLAARRRTTGADEAGASDGASPLNSVLDRQLGTATGSKHP